MLKQNRSGDDLVITADNRIDLPTGSALVEVLGVSEHVDAVLATVGRRPRGHSVVSRLVTVMLQLDRRDGRAARISVHSGHGDLGYLDAEDRPDIVALLEHHAPGDGSALAITCTARVTGEWYGTRRWRDPFYGGAVLLMLDPHVDEHQQVA